MGVVKEINLFFFLVLFLTLRTYLRLARRQSRIYWSRWHPPLKTWKSWCSTSRKRSGRIWLQAFLIRCQVFFPTKTTGWPKRCGAMRSLMPIPSVVFPSSNWTHRSATGASNAPGFPSQDFGGHRSDHELLRGGGWGVNDDVRVLVVRHHKRHPAVGIRRR